VKGKSGRCPINPRSAIISSLTTAQDVKYTLEHFSSVKKLLNVKRKTKHGVRGNKSGRKRKMKGEKDEAGNKQRESCN
jgi:hypothetical protein